MDMDAPDQSWLLLIHYSQKYSISISTLRRRIRSGKIEYRLMEGKYYIKDVPPPGIPQPHSYSDESTMGSFTEILAFCKDLIAGKEKIYQEILKEKMLEVNTLKERIAEQKMLIRILEEKLEPVGLSLCHPENSTSSS